MRAIRPGETVLCFLMALSVGCGKPSLKTGEVEGTITLLDKPLAQVSVLFVPEHVEGSTAPASAAITDDSGHYKLNYTLPNNSDPASPTVGSGAVIGQHTVTLSDIKMKNELLPPPGRIPAKYTDPGSSPLHYDIKEGSQAIDIRLDTQ